MCRAPRIHRPLNSLRVFKLPHLALDLLLAYSHPLTEVTKEIEMNNTEPDEPDEKIRFKNLNKKGPEAVQTSCDKDKVATKGNLSGNLMQK